MRCSALALLAVAVAVAVAVAEPEPEPEPVSGVPGAAHFAVAAYNRASNDVRLWRALRVLRAQWQAEAGYKYNLTMELVPTQCLKNDAGTRDVELRQCPLAPLSERQTLTCDFQIWTRPWLHNTRLISQHCQPHNPDPCPRGTTASVSPQGLTPGIYV